METIERTRTDLMDEISLDVPPSAPVRPPRRWGAVWRRVVSILSYLTLSFGLAGLVSLKDAAARDWRSALGDFRWIVLVTGEALEIDEVGRSLKNFDAVAQVTYHSPQEILESLKAEPLLKDQVSILDPVSLPSTWEVTWSGDFDASKMGEALADVRRLPGVVDVAYDTRQLDKMRTFRLTWLRIRLLIASLAMAGSLIAALLFGRFLFFTRLDALRGPDVAAALLSATAAWSAGVAIAYALIGPVSWHLLWVGPLAGLARLAWTRSQPTE